MTMNKIGPCLASVSQAVPKAGRTEKLLSPSSSTVGMNLKHGLNPFISVGMEHSDSAFCCPCCNSGPYWERSDSVLDHWILYPSSEFSKYTSLRKSFNPSLSLFPHLSKRGLVAVLWQGLNVLLYAVYLAPAWPSIVSIEAVGTTWKTDSSCSC